VIELMTVWSLPTEAVAAAGLITVISSAGSVFVELVCGALG
jgi:hypothetical protein